MKTSGPWLIAMSVFALQGCMSDDDEYVDKSLPNCGHVSGSWVGGTERSGWRDEGKGYISNYSSNWSDTLDLGNEVSGPTARLLYCPSGRGLLIGWSSKSELSPQGFLAAVREQNEIRNIDLVAIKARELNLMAHPTVAKESSEIAECGCRAHYPDLKLPWATQGE